MIRGFERKFGRRTLLQGAAAGGAGVAAAVLIGCGSDDNEGSPTGTPSGAGATATSEAAQGPGLTLADGRFFPYNAPEPAGLKPKDGGTVRIATTWDVSTLDPSKSGAGGTVTVPNTAANRLLGFKRGPGADPFKLDLVPELAKSWENTPDGLSYTFKLVSAKYHNVPPANGRVLVAKDIKAVYERYATSGAQTSYFSNMQSVDAVDDATLKVTLKKPQPDFLVPLASRYLSIYLPELVDSGDIEKMAIGSGPAILIEAIAGQHVTYRKNPDYWAGPVHVDGLEYVIMPDPSAELAALRAGQVHNGLGIQAGVRDLDAILKTNPDMRVEVAPLNPTVFSLSFNLEKLPWSDDRVRQAMSLAIDRKQFLQVLNDGLGYQYPTMPWFFLFDKEPTYESGDLGKWWHYDVAQAKQLLSAAGVPDLTVPLIFYEYGTNEKADSFLADQMRAAGINLQLQKLEYTNYNSLWTGRKIEDAADGWQSAGFDFDN
jgi:peptide/nickel transport system substrate-binding protein